jgi:hypothetical protein
MDRVPARAYARLLALALGISFGAAAALALGASPARAAQNAVTPARAAQNAATPARAAQNAATPARINGQWESVARNKGGIGNILEFNDDGTVTQISAAMSDATYSLQGEWLRLFYTDEATGKVNESDTIVELQGPDRFVEKAEDGTEQAWSERIGSRDSMTEPLVGRWCSVFLDTLTSYKEFTPTGKAFTRMPFVVLRGTYAVDGSDLSVHILGQPEGRYPFRVENGQLVIKNREGLERVYKRSECKLLRGY